MSTEVENQDELDRAIQKLKRDDISIIERLYDVDLNQVQFDENE